jgi:hypothetical protein
MTLPVANLVEQSSVTNGVGNFTLAVLQGRQSFFSAFGVGSGNSFYYFISNPNAIEWEVGFGYLNDSATLVRQTVLNSSNGGSLVNFSTGTKDINNDLPAQFQAQIVIPNYKLISAAGPYTLLPMDGIIEINQTVGAPFTVNVDPSVLTPGKLFTIKDGKGDAAINAISLVLASGTFDGVSPFNLDYAYQAATFYSTGVNLRGVA